MLVHVDWYVIPPPPPYRAVLEMLKSPDDWPAARDKLFEIWRAGVERPEIDAAFDVMSEQAADMWMRSGREIMAGYDRVGSPSDWRGRRSTRRCPCCTPTASPPRPSSWRRRRRSRRSTPGSRCASCPA